MPKDRPINSQEEFVISFLQESTGLYVKVKSNEHSGAVDADQMKKDCKEDLTALIDGLQDDAQKSGKQEEVDILVDSLKEGLPEYIDTLDEKLTQARNEELVQQGHSGDITPDKADEALIKAASTMEFKKPATKEAVLLGLANTCKKIGLGKLSKVLAKQYGKEMAKSEINALKSHQNKKSTEHASKQGQAEAIGK